MPSGYYQGAAVGGENSVNISSVTGGTLEDAVTTTRNSPEWTSDFFGALTTLGSVYLKSKYGQNDEQYVRGSDGQLYPAGQPIYSQPAQSNGLGSMMPLLLIGGLALVVVLVVAD